MPKMPESEKKEESAESREEAKEQERLKAAEAKRIEKERTERYAKLKDGAKDERAKMREKVGIVQLQIYSYYSINLSIFYMACCPNVVVKVLTAESLYQD